ncbi:MAG: hypothetical protein ABI432_00975 [Flavobacteriales bacterium]
MCDLRQIGLFLLCILEVLLCVQDIRAQQGLNNLWLGGYANWAGQPYGGVDIDFHSGNAVVTTMNRAIGFGRSSAKITDASGNLFVGFP